MNLNQYLKLTTIRHLYFKKRPEILICLGVSGGFPNQILGFFFVKTKHYYQTIKDNGEIQAKLNMVKISPEIVDECLAKDQSLLTKRAAYEKRIC
jgi:hypothetical protein